VPPLSPASALAGTAAALAAGNLSGSSSGSGGGSGTTLLELSGHDGYVASAAFVPALGAARLLTASGDGTCIVWDIARRAPALRCTDHGGDVMSIAAQPTSADIFVSGSVDGTARLWDARVSGARAIATFVGHEGDVNAVAFSRNGMCFATGSEDSFVRLFDVRSSSRVAELGGNEAGGAAITSIDFSASGRVIFAGNDDATALGWDVFATPPSAGGGGSRVAPASSGHHGKRAAGGAGGAAIHPDMGVGSGVESYVSGGHSGPFVLSGHANRISSLRVNASGRALATGAWDNEVFIWA
jgi:WD40 repeat protein